MARFKRLAVRKNIKKRAVSLLLSATVLVSSIVFFGDNNMKSVEAKDSRAYMEYIIDRMVNGMQDKLNILEIVPDDSQGVLKYYFGDDDVKIAMENNQAKLEQYYKNNKGGTYTFTTNDGLGEWYTINGDYISRFGVGIRQNILTNKYEVRCPELFYDEVVPNYQDILWGNVEVQTLSPNDVTVEDVKKADLIFIGNYSEEREKAIQFYNDYIGSNENPYYTKEGAPSSSKSYDTYKKVVDEEGVESYIPRDMSWDVCKALIECNTKGRELELPGEAANVTVKTPVILEHELEKLNANTNLYKTALLIGMNLGDNYDVLLDNISTTYIENGVETNYVNEFGVVTPAIDHTGAKTFTKDSLIEWKQGDNESNPIIKLFNNFETKLQYTGENPENYAKPLAQTFLKDDFCVISYNTAFLYTGKDHNHNQGGNRGYTERIGNTATTTDILRYLFGNKNGQSKTFSYPKIRILEIEPCNSFYYDTFEKVKALGERLLMAGTENWTKNNYKNYLDVTCVSTNALNSMTTDLVSDYEMIIIGDNIELLTKDNAGNTIYNDRNLNGYIYLQFGDLMKVGTAYLGFMPTDYVEFKNGDTSGMVKLNASSEYLWTDYVFDALKEEHGDGKYYALRNMYKYYVPNNYKSYDPSNGELFLNYSLGNVRLPDNDITDITKKKLETFVKSGKAVITADCIYNCDYRKVYSTSDMYDYAKTLTQTDASGKKIYSNVIRQNRIGGAVLYRYGNSPKIQMIVKPVEPQYTGDVISTFGDRKLKYVFDVNGQVGKTYKIKLYIDKNNDGVYKELSSGEVEDRNELFFADNLTFTANTMRYTINSGLSDNYVGMLSWKIKVIELDEEGRETANSVSEIGYSAIKNEEMEDIYVLQILPNGANNLNMSTEINGTFQNLLKDVQTQVGYDIHITAITANEYVNKFKKVYNVDNSYKKGQDLNTEKDKLRSYDMVVIGFADMYGSSDIDNTNGALDNILDFMDAGKSVLFTHDTMSWRASGNYMSTDESGNSRIPISSTHETYSDGNYAYVNWASFAYNLTIKMRSKVGMDKYGISLVEADRTGIEKPEYDNSVGKPNYATASADGRYYVEELQGLNSWTVYRGSFLKSYRSDYGYENKNLYSIKPFNESDIQYDKMWVTTQVEQLNKGSVTMYPYKIKENLPVATTHGQYFELDMEDEDIVVWYTLAHCGTNNSKYYKLTSKDGGNNYYIYSKNNITYSGAGHENMGSIPELKLFVNTIVKAISGGNNAPVVKIVNGSKGDGGIYYAFTESVGSSASYELDIKATDADLISLAAANGNINNVGTFKVAELYWIRPDGTEKLIKSFDSADPLRNGIVRRLTLGETNLTPDELAIIQNDVENNRPAKFRIYVEDTLKAFDQIKVYLIQRDLFNLN